MTEKTKRILAIAILLLIIYTSILFPLLMTGCTVTSPLLSARDNKGTVIIEKPPVRIIISGVYTGRMIDINGTDRLLRRLDRMEFENYNFDSHYSIDSEHSTITTEKYETNYNRKRK